MEAQKRETQGQTWQSPAGHCQLFELNITTTCYVPLSTYYVLDAKLTKE